ncbi:MAG: hypothetical protein ABJF23_12710 [Bryobacteraceae bacterium]
MNQAKILADFRRDLRPATPTEDALVDIMARSFFSALRITRIETNLINNQFEAIKDHPAIKAHARKHGTGHEYDTRRLGQAFDADCGNRYAQAKVSKTASTYDQAFLRAQTALLSLRAKGGAA